jgi:hypothetical protein
MMQWVLILQLFSNPGNKSVLTKSSHRQIYSELATAPMKGMKLMKNSQPHMTKTGRQGPRVNFVHVAKTTYVKKAMQCDSCHQTMGVI